MTDLETKNQSIQVLQQCARSAYSRIQPDYESLVYLDLAGNENHRQLHDELKQFEDVYKKSMYFDYGIPELKFSRRWNELSRYRNLYEFAMVNHRVSDHFGLGCFKVQDSAMFNPQFSPALYGLHGEGEILVAKHLHTNFNDSSVLNVDDLVLMRDPRSPDDREEGQPSLLVRRVAALPGEVIQSVNNPEYHIELEPNEIWVMADNNDDDGEGDESLPRGLAVDSRTFGPLDFEAHIFGRVIYSIRSRVDHGPVINKSSASRKWDEAWAENVTIDTIEEILKLYD